MLFRSDARLVVTGSNDCIVAYSASPRIYLGPSTANTKFRIAAQDTVSDTFEIAYSTTSPSGTPINLTYTPGFVMKSGGNVGIGTSSPSSQLTVNSAASGELLRLTNGTNAGRLHFYTNTASVIESQNSDMVVSAYDG